MALPTLLVRYSTDDADDPTPTWVDVTDDVRAVSWSRGRDSERAEVGPGTATIVLNNRNGDWDPVNDATLRPMNRWSIQGVLSASTEDAFLGYAESYEQQWPGVGQDGITIVSCVDEFKVLAQDQLPATDPPRESYQDLVMYDKPVGYWPMDNATVTMAQEAVVGEPLTAVNSMGSIIGGNGAILGQTVSAYADMTGTGYFRTIPVSAGHAFDPGEQTEFTVEGWFGLYDGLPTAGENLVRGPTTTAGFSWAIEIDTAGTVIVLARNTSVVTYSVASTTTLPNDGTFHHIVGTITGGLLRVYFDGVEEDSTAFTGEFSAITTPADLTIGNGGTTIGTKNRLFDELAVYRQGLSADRVAAHYTAATARGFPGVQRSEARIDAILDEVGSIAPRSMPVGIRYLIAAYMHGQSPLEEIRKVESVEADNSVFFAARDGTLTFLDGHHRVGAPYSIVQATFDDDGTDLPYQDISLDYSDSFIANEWNVSRVGGLIYTASDATSISRYGKRSETLADLPAYNVGDEIDIATENLAKYKDPMTRITSLSVITHPAANAEAILPLDIGDRIRVFRTPMGGGSRIDQTLFIQKIDGQAVPGQPWRIRLGVSPL